VSATRVDHSLLIAASPATVLAAFFDADALALWWKTVRSVTTPRPLGVYAVEWEATTIRDDLLGPLGGVFHGTVMEYRADREFFLADAFWVPPEGQPVGPMGLEVSCTVEGPVSRLHVVQNGHEEGLRWNRYYSVITPGWKSSLRWLKRYIEQGPEAVMAEREKTSPKQFPSNRPRVRLR
jgi:uncharacterized protein YndB with AHSA1/START domain